MFERREYIVGVVCDTCGVSIPMHQATEAGAHAVLAAHEWTVSSHCVGLDPPPTFCKSCSDKRFVGKEEVLKNNFVNNLANEYVIPTEFVNDPRIVEALVNCMFNALSRSSV